MYCFANTLPFPEERKPWEDAITRGVGTKAEKIEHFSIVTGQATPMVEVRFSFKGTPAGYRILNIASEDGLAEVERRVRRALSDL
jgi:hypothetical protein